MGQLSNALRQAWTKYNRQVGALVGDQDMDGMIDSCCALGGIGLILGVPIDELNFYPGNTESARRAALQIDQILDCQVMNSKEELGGRVYTQIYSMSDNDVTLDVICAYLDEQEARLCGPGS